MAEGQQLLASLPPHGDWAMWDNLGPRLEHASVLNLPLLARKPVVQADRWLGEQTDRLGRERRDVGNQVQPELGQWLVDLAAKDHVRGRLWVGHSKFGLPTKTKSTLDALRAPNQARDSTLQVMRLPQSARESTRKDRRADFLHQIQ